MWEKEKILEIIIFSFSHIVFNSITDKFHHFSHINFELLSSANAFSWDKSDSVLFGRQRVQSKWQNCRPVKIQSICIQQNQSDANIDIYFGKSWKHFMIRRKRWLPAFSPFPTLLLKAFPGLKSGIV